MLTKKKTANIYIWEHKVDNIGNIANLVCLSKTRVEKFFHSFSVVHGMGSASICNGNADSITWHKRNTFQGWILQCFSKFQMAQLKHKRHFSRFSQMHNIGNNGNIAICVFSYICSFILYSNGIVLVNPNFDITGCKSITFQGWILQ